MTAFAQPPLPLLSLLGYVKLWFWCVHSFGQYQCILEDIWSRSEQQNWFSFCFTSVCHPAGNSSDQIMFTYFFYKMSRCETQTNQSVWFQLCSVLAKSHSRVKFWFHISDGDDFFLLPTDVFFTQCCLKC